MAYTPNESETKREEKKKALNKYSTRKTFTFDAKHTLMHNTEKNIDWSIYIKDIEKRMGVAIRWEDYLYVDRFERWSLITSRILP